MQTTVVKRYSLNSLDAAGAASQTLSLRCRAGDQAWDDTGQRTVCKAKSDSSDALAQSRTERPWWPFTRCSRLVVGQETTVDSQSYQPYWEKIHVQSGQAQQKFTELVF